MLRNQNAYSVQLEGPYVPLLMFWEKCRQLKAIVLSAGVQNYYSFACNKRGLVERPEKNLLS